jgi:NADPH-dependent curcumin reductase CurA
MNRVWKYVKRSETTIASDWELSTETLPALDDGKVLLETVYVSVDPYLRIQASTQKTWQDPYPLGAVQRSFAICRVVESRSPLLSVGDYVRSYVGWVERCVEDAKSVTKLPRNDKIPLSEHLASLGMVGITSYWGVKHVCEPIRVGETAFVTGAAGAVGIYVCQLLKKRGCFVVGVAGTDEKCALLKSTFGCDVAINYKTTAITSQSLAAVCPSGIDIFFDNVGGEIFDAAITLMNVHGRVVICGQISQYDALDKPENGPRFLHLFIYKRVKLEGILQRDADAEVERA